MKRGGFVGLVGALWMGGDLATPVRVEAKPAVIADTVMRPQDLRPPADAQFIEGTAIDYMDVSRRFFDSIFSKGEVVDARIANRGLAVLRDWKERGRP